MMLSIDPHADVKGDATSPGPVELGRQVAEHLGRAHRPEPTAAELVEHHPLDSEAPTVDVELYQHTAYVCVGTYSIELWGWADGEGWTLCPVAVREADGVLHHTPDVLSRHGLTVADVRLVVADAQRLAA